jgi:hypothetical protein
VELKVTRRDALIGGIAAAMCARGTALARACISQAASAVNFDIPADACDCCFGAAQSSKAKG